MRDRAHRAAPLLGFAALCYLPLLRSAPGQVVADTKSYLYLDPDRLLGRAWSMWDPHVGLGTVTHQSIGFLWPMGPYYWAMEHLGVPDWVAQRLWLGSIMCAAGLGVRFLLRTFGWRGHAVGAAMVVYALSPYLLTIAVRISAILLPYAALPWLIALAARAARTGGWRHPAVFALVVTTVGTSNATAILLAGVGPLVWLTWTSLVRAHPVGDVLRAAGRIGALTLAVNAWWIVGLSVQATNGIEVLRYTESVATTASASAAQEVLRGLGYWFFYGDDAIGPWVGPSTPYLTSPWLIAVTFALPTLALGAAAIARWRERAVVVTLVVVGVVLAVGVHPPQDPTPFGALLARFLHSDVGMAMRSMPRAAPLVVLALALMLAAGIHALTQRSGRLGRGAAAAVAILAVLGLPPLWQGTFAPENLRRPEDIPRYWHEAAHHLDATDDGTRVLEVPGADFTSYRWGTTVDPVTPGLMDRPMVARELVPMGSGPAWNLLKAFDGRLQAGTAEATSIAPVARVLRSGQVLLRSDLQYEHYDTPRPRDLYAFLLRAPGLAPPTEFGRRQPNVAEPPAPMLDELELSRDPSLADPFPVSVLPVQGPVPIVTLKPTVGPVLIAGDGDGIVDLAAAGLIDGTELLRYSAAMDDEELAAALDAGAVLVVTDTNRRRGERWGTIRFTNGYTEPAGLVALRIDRTDARLPVFEDPDPADVTRTVALHRGGITANATSYGGRNEYLPEDRPAHAVDGDPTTAWRTGRDDPVRGERLRIDLEEPVRTSSIGFLAPPPPINRWVTRVALRFDDGPVQEVRLDERSRSGAGQRVSIGRARTFTRLEIEVLDDSAGSQGRYGGLTSTGFAEVTIGDRRLDEAVRPPTDLLARAGRASTDRPLAIVLTRLRSAPTDIERLDEESRLVRSLELPEARELALTGTARLSARAPDEVLESLLTPGTTFHARSSSRLPSLTSTARSAADGDPATAWVAAYGDQVGQWLELRDGRVHETDRVRLTLRTDGRHSVPTTIGLEVDGQRLATLTLPDLADAGSPGATQVVTLRLPEAVSGQVFRLVVDDVRALTTTDWGTRRARTLPVGIAEARIGDLDAPSLPSTFTSGCRQDLLTVDGAPVAIEVSGDVQDARRGAPLRLRSCDGAPVALAGGESHLDARPGAMTGIDLDRLVLRSAAGGGPAPAASLGETLNAGASRPEAPRATVLTAQADRVRVRVDGATPGTETWLSFGQSHNDGWRASIDGEDLGRPALIDGFANGWLLRPERASFVVDLEFTPQRRVDLALWFSLLSALGCLVLSLRGRADVPVGDPAPGGDRPSLAVDAGDGSPRLALPWAAAAALIAALAGVALATPVVGVLLGALAWVVATATTPALRRASALAAPAAMAMSGAYVVSAVLRHGLGAGLDWPSEVARAHPLAWFAVLALATETAVSAVRRWRR